MTDTALQLPSAVWLLRVGQTPLLPLPALSRELPEGVTLWAKAEFANPGGSVKDRPALEMILDAERRGLLGPGRALLEATSGNTGIALAMLGASRGYRVVLCLPANVSPERKRILRAYGAELILTDPEEGTDGAIRRARELQREKPESYVYTDQYSNPANWQAHYRTTAPEIFEQTEGRITHFVAGVGTSGTLMGTGRRLLELKPSVRLVSVQPASPWHGIEGLKHMASAEVPAIYDADLAHENMVVETEEAQAMARRLALEEGLLVGTSSGANVLAALRVARRLSEGVVVTVLCDGGNRYLSEPYWDEDLLLRESVTAAGPVLELPRRLLREIHEHGRRTYPEECCGLLVGSMERGRRKVLEIWPLENQGSPAERRRRYWIAPEVFLSSMKRARREGVDLIGVYHSHPDHPGFPSEYDREQAQPNWSYVVFSVTRGEPGRLGSWVLSEDGTRFLPERIVLVRDPKATR
jgi:cysteine synthase B